MFAFFKRHKVTIQSVAIPNFGWKKVKDNTFIIQWINPEQTIAVSVNFFGLPPDIPTTTQINKLRDFYTASIAAVNGGVIEVDILKIAGISVAKTIFKFPQKPSGLTYLASLTIPFESCSFVVKVQCVETGATGMREAVIANRLLASGDLTIGSDGFQNWPVETYDDSVKVKNMMNKSEQQIYDHEFLFHPLTQAREIIDKIKNGIVFKDEIRKLNPLKR